MTLYLKRATSGREASHDEKLAGLLDVLEITDLAELHPSTADLMKRRLLTLGSDELLDILMTVEYAKELYAARTAKGSDKSA